MKDQTGRVAAKFNILNKTICFYKCDPCGPCADEYASEVHCFDADGNNMGKLETAGQ